MWIEPKWFLVRPVRRFSLSAVCSKTSGISPQGPKPVAVIQVQMSALVLAVACMLCLVAVCTETRRLDCP
jgi:hypothetical protein